MHSAALDSSGSPRKRTVSRGMSEDESLRSIIKETDSSTRRLPRSDSRTGTLRKRTDSQSDQDLFMGLPDMLELQASYDEAVQELRGLEVEREALLFQVDVLQDSLEGVEELLAEAQREAGQAGLALEREREEKRKLESLVCSLMKEVERLREEATSHHEEERDSLLCEPCSTKLANGRVAGPEEGGQTAGGVLTKLRRMVNQLPAPLPSLSLDGGAAADGVLQRPYESHRRDGRDPSPDRNDSDKSAYEDASAETPEQDRTFPGDGDLPHDSEDKGKCPADDSQTQDSANPDACVLS
ncbi:PREDICTED: leucine-rich repeat flightless-interacting protein 2-like isoform X2 [Poecilia mexicana]|uniref:leucine-rich repeat flightless-interacting protein 2-like isoform X2 n=1 Tax=Poecilia mexicana TaxID=48701 RepID=UPI00072EB3F7|nr:PREDICTED: leucine-rich repeat flightless-interacting protein 2-like isoform X2 [Poecilia mexicana]